MTMSTSRPHPDLFEQRTVEIPRYAFGGPATASPAPTRPDFGGYPGPGEWATRGAGFPAGMPPTPPAGSGGFGGYSTPPGGPAGGGGRRAWWVAGVAALVIIVALVVGVVVWNVRGGDDATSSSTSTTSAAGPATSRPTPAPTTSELPPKDKPLGAAQLEELLLTPGEIVAAIDQPGTAVYAKSQPARSKLYVDTISENDCLGMAFTAEKEVYRGTGFTAAQTQMTMARRDTKSPVLWVHDGAMFSFPSPQAAADFVATSTATWKRCQGRSWTHRATDSSGETYQTSWNAGQVSTAGGVTSVLLTRAGEGNWTCGRALTAASSVVVDVAVCGNGAPESAVTGAARAVADKVPGA